jgi:hypothetical protein
LAGSAFDSGFALYALILSEWSLSMWILLTQAYVSFSDRFCGAVRVSAPFWKVLRAEGVAVVGATGMCTCVCSS